MDRVYRLRRNGAPFYAVERDGTFSEAKPTASSIFDGYVAGDRLAEGLKGAEAAGPGAAVEDRLCRPELQGSRG